MNLHTLIHTDIYIYIYIYKFTHIPTNTHTHTHTHTHTQTHTQTHTYTHIYIYIYMEEIVLVFVVENRSEFESIHEVADISQSANTLRNVMTPTILHRAMDKCLGIRRLFNFGMAAGIGERKPLNSG